MNVSIIFFSTITLAKGQLNPNRKEQERGISGQGEGAQQVFLDVSREWDVGLGLELMPDPSPVSQTESSSSELSCSAQIYTMTFGGSDPSRSFGDAAVLPEVKGT